MTLFRRKDRKSEEWLTKKQERSLNQSHYFSSIVLSKQKRFKLMKGNLLSFDNVMAPYLRIFKFQIDAQKFGEFTAQEVLRILIRLK